MQIVQTSLVASILVLSFASCNDPSRGGAASRVKWGQLNGGETANIIGISPGESLEFCSDDPAAVAGAERATEKWSSVIGRWGHFKMNKCGSQSTVKINISGFGQTGLNYWNANPGRIYVNSSATGNFLNAILLHEVGHSFGLCDQYMGAAQANCSENRMSAQQNSEIMGSTSPSKLEVTGGDIEGVKSVSVDASIDSTSKWIALLKTNPTVNPNGNPTPGGLFVALDSGSGEGTPKIEISGPKGQEISLCSASSPSETTCRDANKIPVKLDRTSGDVDIYRTVDAVASLSQTQANGFIGVAGTQTLKFEVAPNR